MTVEASSEPSDFVAEAFFSLSSYCNTPLCWAGRCFFRSISKIPLVERPDFFSNRWVEILFRVPLLLAAGGLTIPSIIFAIPGGVFHAIGCSLQRKNFTMVGQLSQQEKKPIEQITLLWWNVAGIAGGIGKIQGGLPDCEHRVESIAEVILNQNCDVAALTEVYDKTFQNQLEKKFLEKGYQVIKNVGFNGNPTIAPSGLFFASRIPLSEVHFTPFGAQSFEANKGFLSCEVSFQERKVVIIATHLKDSKDELAPSDVEKKRRQEQIEKINEDIGEKEALLVGDLNIVKNSDEERILSRWKESNGEQNIGHTYTNEGVQEIWGSPPLIQVGIDYVRSNRQNLQVTVAKVDALCNEEGLRLSDHSPLFATVDPLPSSSHLS